MSNWSQDLRGVRNLSEVSASSAISAGTGFTLAVNYSQ